MEQTAHCGSSSVQIKALNTVDSTGRLNLGARSRKGPQHWRVYDEVLDVKYIAADIVSEFLKNGIIADIIVGMRPVFIETASWRWTFFYMCVRGKLPEPGFCSFWWASTTSWV